MVEEDLPNSALFTISSSSQSREPFRGVGPLAQCSYATIL